MISVLWASLILLVIASVIPKRYNSRFAIGGSGWIFLSIYLGFQLEPYLKIEDYLNAFLAVAAAIVSIFIAYIVFRYGDRKDKEQEEFFSLSRAASVGGLIYFLFAEVEFLNNRIISTVNGSVVEIILACTAIESIALFAGTITSAAGAPASRKLRAFVISYYVLKILPEVLDMLDGVVRMIRIEFRRLAVS
ncbi:MAG: hypothetical protein Q8M95_15660 [Candidatus Methanoperedens sp.]|nr:hypothetical protein [Candidatus Methanoperedens sp.]